MSQTSFSFHPDAIAEALPAARRYKERTQSAAEKFIAELDQVIEKTAAAPFRWPITQRGTRQVRLPRFPYFVIYRSTENSIPILAVAHGHRRPGYWKNRL
jgi:toxin ParE2